MAGTVRLILAFHNHQPVGNFDGVFEQAYQESYLPFLSVLEEYPEICFSLHTSGSLLEWLEVAHPEYVDRVRQLVQRNQVEIIGGAFYEPILANIPRRDRIGQINQYRDHLESVFETSVRGMWVPERVWEQSFTGDLTAAGVRYTILDDYHFKCGGLSSEQLHGYYLTEDEGRLLSVFPGSETLRYQIPFRDPYETIEYLRGIAGEHDNPVVVFGDDGEKFGSWPETFKHVYEDGWLHRFLQALRENESWLQVTTPGETIDHVGPLGRFFLPDASYREMTEWVLPAKRQQEYVSLTHREYDDETSRKLVAFTRGGFWRNFRTKYSESNEMYARMMEISARVAELDADGENTEQATQVLEKVRQNLYRAQCNCSYWHGAFGGLYLPHLRNAVFAQLIEADNLLEQHGRSSESWIDVVTGDFNFDGRQEIKLSNHRLAAYFAPASGGHMYELDIRSCKSNMLATLNRREEPYHRKILDHAEKLLENGEDTAAGEVASIHDIVRFKQPNLDQKIAYDTWPRKSLVDHFLQPKLTLDGFRKCEGLVSDFATQTYEASVRRTSREIAIDLRGQGHIGPYAIKIRKVVVMSEDRPNEIVIQYQLHDLPQDVPLHFGAEFNFATMPGGASDRYFYDAQGSQIGTLETQQSLDQSSRIGLVDEWQGIDASLEVSEDAGFWTFPIETISQSESGFEAVHQSVVVLPHWEFVAPKDGPWCVDIRLVIDTSVARARQLASLTEIRQNTSEAEQHHHAEETTGVQN